MVRHHAIRHAIAAVLAAVLIPSLAFGQFAYAPFILTTGVDEADAFVTLAESTTFGPGGSIFDYSTRIIPRPYHGAPPANGTYTTTTNMADSCSSDETTWNTFKEYLDGDSTGDSSDSTVIVLPASCRMKAFLAPGYSDVVDLVIANKYDNVKIYCADEDTCGIENNLDSVSAITENNRATAVQVGASGVTNTGASYSITATSYSFGSKMVQSASAIDVTDSGDGVAWGPGDIVELSTSQITGYGTNNPDWMTRITCIRDNSGNLYGTDCAEITGNNQFQLEDIPPFNLKPDAYYWGNAAEGLGDTVQLYSPAGTPSSTFVYAATSGHSISQVERMGSGRCGIVGDGSVCGIGTETNNIAENIWFENVSYTTADNVLGTRYQIGANWYGGGNYGGNVERTVGRVSAFTYGNRANGWRASHLSMNSMNWTGTGANVKCIGEVVSISATNPVTVDVRTSSELDCSTDDSDDNNWGEPEIIFSWDVADSRLAGQRFLVTRGAYSAGPPATRTMTLTGLNGSDPDGSAVAIDTTAVGTAGGVDRFGGASFYLNDSSSYIQIINNVFLNTRQHAIMQGCAACVYAANYVRRIPSESVGGRGPFYHANRGESGNIFEMNDQDHPFIVMDSGNGEPTGHGEGANHVWFKNRSVSVGTTTWPLGTATGTNYGGNYLISLLQTGQNGAANDDWSFLGNSSATGLWNGTIDDCDNNDGDDLLTTCVAPGATWSPAVYRNKCATCNQDANWETALRSPDTSGDILGTEDGDSASGVPAAWTGAGEPGEEPTSLVFETTPDFWCVESGTFGEFGAYYDDFGGTLSKLPAQIRYEGTTCTPP